MTYPPGPANSGHTPLPPTPDASGQFYLRQMAPPRRRRWLIPALIAGALAVLGLGLALGATVFGGKDTPPVAATSTPSTPPGTPAAKDSAGQRACDAVKAANAGPNAFAPDPVAMAALAIDGGQSTNPFVRGAAAKVTEAARAAVAAKGTDDVGVRGIQLGTAALELETTCIQQWYYPKP